MQAQSAALPVRAVGYRYCALVVRDDHLNAPGNLYLDYGQGAEIPVVNAALDDAAKQIEKARSVIAVLNYLDELGWECFATTNAPISTISGNYVTSETRYLFRQRQP